MRPRAGAYLPTDQGLASGPLLALIAGVRSSILLSILACFAAGACGKSLTNTSETGGTGPAAGGSGGTAIHQETGGNGGNVPTPSCDELATEYQTAFSLAGNCTVGAPGQCQQLVSTSPYPCGGCSTYVNDSSALTAIMSAWNQAGCGGAVPPCGLGACLGDTLNNTCVSIDGGTIGYCEYVSSSGTGAAGTTGATGGFSGAGGTGGGAGGSSADGGLLGPVEAILTPTPDDPTAFTLELSNAPLSCANQVPTLPCPSHGSAYFVAIVIPGAELAPGTLALEDPIASNCSEMVPNSTSPLTCQFDGGTFLGTLEIVSVSSTDMVFKLQGSGPNPLYINGTFTAQRCAGAVDAGP
jgi:hypothetical protein